VKAPQKLHGIMRNTDESRSQTSLQEVTEEDAEIEKLQEIQNFAPRILTGTREYEHITPISISDGCQYLPCWHFMMQF